MNTFEFASELEKAVENGATGEIERWLEGSRDLQSQYTTRLIFLARYIDSIPTEFKDKYVETLVSALESVPDDFKVKTSDMLKEKLQALVDSQDKKSLRERLRIVLEMHLIE